jgi:hypothetical protein
MAVLLIQKWKFASYLLQNSVIYFNVSFDFTSIKEAELPHYYGLNV